MKLDEVGRAEIGTKQLHVVSSRFETAVQIEDVIQIAFEGEPSQVSPITAAFRVHGVADVWSNLTVGPAIDEPDGWIVAILHFAYEQPPVNGIVRHVDARTERRAAARARELRGIQVVAADLEYLFSKKRRRREREIRSDRLPRRFSRTAAVRDQRADVRLPPEPPLRSQHREILAANGAAIARPDVHGADVERAGVSGQLRAVVDRLRHAGVV